MLAKLMELIGIEEKKYGDNKPKPSPESSIKLTNNPFNGLHSFWPEAWPGDNVSQVHPSEEETRERDNARGTADQLAARQLRALKAHRRYLPCHYFDYICGSSTGA
jgi:hypothetical protein